MKRGICSVCMCIFLLVSGPLALEAGTVQFETQFLDTRPPEQWQREDREEIGRIGPMQNYRLPVRPEAGTMALTPNSNVPVRSLQSYRRGQADTYGVEIQRLALFIIEIE